MKISTKGRYSLRFMLDLALENQDTPIRIKEIAARQEISEKYLEQIVSVLTKAGYVKSVRGSQGGYMLAHEPSYYTVGMVLRLSEGSLAPVTCLDFEENTCSRQNDCATLLLWQKLDEAIRGVVDFVTLEDLVQWQKKGNEGK